VQDRDQGWALDAYKQALGSSLWGPSSSAILWPARHQTPEGRVATELLMDFNHFVEIQEIVRGGHTVSLVLNLVLIQLPRDVLALSGSVSRLISCG
jgi:hypothetical protein